MNAALPQRKIQERSGRVFKPVAFSFANPQQGRCRHIHHKALESEREKAEIGWNRHLKKLPALQPGGNLMGARGGNQPKDSIRSAVSKMPGKIVANDQP